MSWVERGGEGRRTAEVEGCGAGALPGVGLGVCVWVRVVGAVGLGRGGGGGGGGRHAGDVSAILHRTPRECPRRSCRCCCYCCTSMSALSASAGSDKTCKRWSTVIHVRTLGRGIRRRDGISLRLLWLPGRSNGICCA